MFLGDTQYYVQVASLTLAEHFMSTMVWESPPAERFSCIIPKKIPY